MPADTYYDFIAHEPGADAPSILCPADMMYRPSPHDQGYSRHKDIHAVFVDRLHAINPELKKVIGYEPLGDEVHEQDDALKDAIIQLSTEHPGITFRLMIHDTGQGIKMMFVAKGGIGVDYEGETVYVKPQPYVPSPQRT
jgi:hypothetical protein